MKLTGEILIGADSRAGTANRFRAVNAATFEEIAPDFGTASQADIEAACDLAWQAFSAYKNVPPAMRAKFLEAIADEITAVGEVVVARARLETGLPEARLQGELKRSAGQLQMFARGLREGGFLDIRIDAAMADRTPPRSDLRLMHVPLGPVAVFGASNFPLAFSVAGGDTASAFAAGCPVIVKAHGAHPGTSEIIGRAVQKAVRACAMPEGVFSLLFGAGSSVGRALVADPRIKAVGFTGSRQGGLALQKIAQTRKEPIPVYAEMSSINPVILFPEALSERGDAIAQDFVSALALGAGQFCTNPGLLLALDNQKTDQFIERVKTAMAEVEPAIMLTPNIRDAYLTGVDALDGNSATKCLAQSKAGDERTAGASLFEATAEDFLSDQALQNEVFGAAGLLVRCRDLDALEAAVKVLEGQLTISMHVAEDDRGAVEKIVPLAEQKAGRIIFNGFGVGVEVCDAMVHGGPYPSTTDVRTTSVGSLAIMRFLRPVCYQDAPSYALNEAIRDDNPLGAPRRMNGELELPQ